MNIHDKEKGRRQAAAVIVRRLQQVVRPPFFLTVLNYEL
jgi:hypothetical protein